MLKSQPSNDSSLCGSSAENVGICTLSKCVKSIPNHLPSVRVPNLNDEEIWAIKTLPTDWEPISKPSEIIEKLTRSRNKRDEVVKQEIRAQFVAINELAAEEIRSKGGYIKELFDIIEMQVKDTNEIIDLYSEEEKLSLSLVDFNVTSTNIFRTYELYNYQLDNFYKFLGNLEKWRSDNYKEVLKWAYRALDEISYQLPYELQQYFENEILEINQMLLNNFRCYAELEVHLNMQAETSQYLQMQNFEVIKIAWKDLKKKHALIEFNKNKLLQSDCESIMLATERGRTASLHFTKNERTFEKMWKIKSSFPVASENALEWTNELQEVMDDLDLCAVTLIKLYKLAIVQVFEGYFDDLQELGDGLVKMGFAEPSELKTLSAEVCQPTIEVITGQYSEDVNTLQQLWEVTIKTLKDKVQNASLFLKEAAHLWDLHFVRLNDVKRIILAELRKLIDVNEKTTRSMELKLDVYVDTVRHSPTLESLEKSMSDVDGLLELRCKTYKDNYEKEIKVLEKLNMYAEQEVEILLSELKLFLDANPKPAKPSISETNSENEVREDNPRRSTFLPMQMKQCKSQIDAIDNWVLGLWKGIENYMDGCTDEALESATTWVEDYRSKVTKRYEIKFSFHLSRSERLKQDMFEIRRLEITRHVDRLARHKAGAENEIDLLKESYAVFEQKYNNVIDEYVDKIHEIKIKRSDGQRSHNATALIRETKSVTQSYKNKLKGLEDELKTLCDDKLAAVREASINCCRKVKLFVDHGGFNYEEGKQITKDLKKFDGKILKKFNVVLKEISGKQAKVFQKITSVQADTLAIFQRHFDELHFSESALEAIKKLQVELRTEVYNAKFQQKRMTSSFQGAEENLLRTLGDVEFIDEFQSIFNNILCSLSEVNDHLCQTPQLINANHQFCDQLNKSDGEDYMELLGEVELTKNETFISKMFSLIYNSLQSLESEAKEFYDTHKQIQIEDKVQPTYEDFMDEVFEKYTFYHLQCELVWLDEVNEYLNSLYFIYQFLNTYHKQFLATLYKSHTQKFREDHNNLLAGVTELKSHNINELMTLRNKLRALHGFKSNSVMLEELEKEMEEKVEEMSAFNISELVQPHRESQEDAVNLFVNELEETRERLELFYKEILGNILDNSLITQFEQKWLFIQNLIKSESQEAGDSRKNYNYCRQIRNMTIPVVYKNIIEKFKALKSEPNDVQYRESEFCMHPCKLREKFEDEYKSCAAEIDSIESSWSKDIQAGYQIFKDDVQRILKLCNVKYKNNPN